MEDTAICVRKQLIDGQVVSTYITPDYEASMKEEISAIEARKSQILAEINSGLQKDTLQNAINLANETMQQSSASIAKLFSEPPASFKSQRNSAFSWFDAAQNPRSDSPIEEIDSKTPENPPPKTVIPASTKQLQSDQPNSPPLPKEKNPVLDALKKKHDAVEKQKEEAFLQELERVNKLRRAEKPLHCTGHVKVVVVVVVSALCAGVLGYVVKVTCF